MGRLRKDGFCTNRVMIRFIRKRGLTVDQYQSWTGGQNFNAFIRANPTWTQRQWEESVVENIETIRGN